MVATTINRRGGHGGQQPLEPNICSVHSKQFTANKPVRDRVPSTLPHVVEADSYPFILSMDVKIFLSQIGCVRRNTLAYASHLVYRLSGKCNIPALKPYTIL